MLVRNNDQSRLGKQNVETAVLGVKNDETNSEKGKGVSEEKMIAETFTMHNNFDFEIGLLKINSRHLTKANLNSHY